MTATEGSLCTGYNGVGVATTKVLGTELAWYSEVDPAACRLLAARYPGVPNVGDLTVADWKELPAVDVLTAGYPGSVPTVFACRPAAGNQR